MRAPLIIWICSVGALLLSIDAAAAPKKKPAVVQQQPHKKGATHTRPVDFHSSLPNPPSDAPGSAEDKQNAPVAGAPPPSRGPSRIDFDDRLIQGQTNKSGAVYLYDRKELKNRSMIKTPDSFRQEIVGAVYDAP
jgi:hypothetical protein